VLAIGPIEFLAEHALAEGPNVFMRAGFATGEKIFFWTVGIFLGICLINAIIEDLGDTFHKGTRAKINALPENVRNVLGKPRLYRLYHLGGMTPKFFSILQAAEPLFDRLSRGELRTLARSCGRCFTDIVEFISSHEDRFRGLEGRTVSLFINYVGKRVGPMRQIELFNDVKRNFDTLVLLGATGSNINAMMEFLFACGINGCSAVKRNADSPVESVHHKRLYGGAELWRRRTLAVDGFIKCFYETDPFEFYSPASVRKDFYHTDPFEDFPVVPPRWMLDGFFAKLKGKGEPQKDHAVSDSPLTIRQVIKLYHLREKTGYPVVAAWNDDPVLRACFDIFNNDGNAVALFDAVCRHYIEDGIRTPQDEKTHLLYDVYHAAPKKFTAEAVAEAARERHRLRFEAFCAFHRNMPAFGRILDFILEDRVLVEKTGSAIRGIWIGAVAARMLMDVPMKEYSYPIHKRVFKTYGGFSLISGDAGGRMINTGVVREQTKVVRTFKYTNHDQDVVAALVVVLRHYGIFDEVVAELRKSNSGELLGAQLMSGGMYLDRDLKRKIHVHLRDPF